MSQPVNLDVRNFSSNGSDGYTNVQASNGRTYSYQYTGGTDGHGNNTVTVGGGQASIEVWLHSDPRYSITSITFNPNDNQFSWHAGNNAAVAVINDTATAAVSVKWTATVTDSTAQCTIPCDPTIDNKAPSR